MTEDDSLGLESKYLIVNDMGCKFSLWVNTVGYQPIPLNSPYPLKEHSSGYYFNTEKGRVLREYQLVYITKGRGLFSSDSAPERQAYKGRLMVLSPGWWHTCYPLRRIGWTECYIGFEGPMIDTIMGDAFLSQERQVLEVSINEELVSLLSCASGVAEMNKISAQQHLSEVVLRMIDMISSIFKNKVFEISDVDREIEQAEILVNENVSNNIDPGELAMRLNISYSWFCRVFKEYTGCTPARCFQGLKSRKAKRMLVGTSQSIREASFSLGSQSAEHSFSFFKKRTGLTPFEYRPLDREGQT